MLATYLNKLLSYSDIECLLKIKLEDLNYEKQYLCKIFK